MRLLGCTETVTLVRHMQTPDGDSYRCETIQGVSWFEQAGSALSASNGEVPHTEVTVRIPADVCPKQLPAPGDYLVKGTVPGGTKPTPANLSIRDSFRINTVGDNRRVCLPHVVVKSA